MTDTEDHQQIMAWTGAPLVQNAAQPVANAGTIVGTWRVDQWQGVQVYVFPSTRAQRWNFTYYTDEGLSFQLGDRFYDLSSGATLRAFEPNLGPVLRVTAQAAVADTFAGVAIVPSNVGLSPSRSRWWGILGLVDVVSVAAAGVLTVDLDPYRGPAVFSVDTAAAAWIVDLKGLDYLGANGARYAHFTSLYKGQPFLVHLGGYRNQLLLTNSDAAPKTFIASVVAGG